MTPVTCEVHQLGKDDPDKRVVRIRTTAFRDKKDKFIVRITSTQGKSACFEALYADDTYMKNKNFGYLLILRNIIGLNLQEFELKGLNGPIGTS